MEEQSFLLRRAFYRPDEVAEILRVSRRTIYRMMKDGRLPFFKLSFGPKKVSYQALTNLINNKQGEQ